MGNRIFHLLRYSRRYDRFIEIKEENNRNKVREFRNKTAVRNAIILLRKNSPDVEMRFKISEGKIKCLSCNSYRIINDFMGICNICKQDINSKIVTEGIK